MKNYTIVRLFACCALCVLAGCSGMKKQLGIERTAPDEFEVVRQAPLAMPPDYTLRPPRPGTARPQEAATVQQAQTTVFGADAAEPARDPNTVTSGEQAVLVRAGADMARPNIRQIVDRETSAVPKRTTALQKMRLAEPSKTGTVVNPAAESARLKAAAQKNQSLTAGKTPSVDQ